ncbi:MAG: DUF4054 domain-containing protein [Acetobacter sp.]
MSGTTTSGGATPDTATVAPAGAAGTAAGNTAADTTPAGTTLAGAGATTPAPSALVVGSAWASATPGVVVFDYAAWSANFGALAANVGAAQAQACFEQATLYLPNTPTSPVRDVGRRTLLLGLLVAHIATLGLPPEQGGNGGLVGRVASASRGSVSVTTDYAPASERAAWFAQTQYGAAFWAATRGLRQARYLPGGPQIPRIWP